MNSLLLCVFLSPVLPVTHCSLLPPLCPPSLLRQLLAVFRFATLILAYAVCKLRHWWAIAVSTLRYSALFVSAGGAAGQERLRIRLVDAVVFIFNGCTVNIKDIESIEITSLSSGKQKARHRKHKTKIGAFTVCASLYSDMYIDWLTDKNNNLNMIYKSVEYCYTVPVWSTVCVVPLERLRRVDLTWQLFLRFAVSLIKHPVSRRGRQCSFLFVDAVVRRSLSLILQLSGFLINLSLRCSVFFQWSLVEVSQFDSHSFWFLLLIWIPPVSFKKTCKCMNRISDHFLIMLCSLKKNQLGTRSSCWTLYL